MGMLDRLDRRNQRMMDKALANPNAGLGSGLPVWVEIGPLLVSPVISVLAAPFWLGVAAFAGWLVVVTVLARRQRRRLRLPIGPSAGDPSRAAR